MSSGFATNCTTRTPYTYLIGWSTLNKWYYGRRTALKCHPDEFWKTYFTSSKRVKEFVKNYGDPDKIIIDVIFDDVEACKLYEEWFHYMNDVVKSEIWLNESYASGVKDTTNKFNVRDKSGNVFLISKNDPRLTTGELVAESKGRTYPKLVTRIRDRREMTVRAFNNWVKLQCPIYAAAVKLKKQKTGKGKKRIGPRRKFKPVPPPPRCCRIKDRKEMSVTNFYKYKRFW